MVDEFIGQTFNGGKMVVVGWNGERQKRVKLYSCHCSECAKDPELFGDAMFRSLKSGLVNLGQLPCGCSKKPKWTADQYRILISRKALGRYSAVIPDDARSTTNVLCKCSIEGCGYTWESSIASLLNKGSGCRRCFDNAKGEAQTTPESIAIGKILKIADEKGWIFHGFKSGWKNTRSRILLECSHSHQWDVEYSNVVYGGTGCSRCADYGYNSGLPGTFYTYIWTHPETKHNFLKYGITNYPEQRIKQQRQKNSPFDANQLCSIDFADGLVPENLEKVIDEYKKQSQIPNQVSKSVFPDGFSETLPTEEWSFISNLVFQPTTTFRK